MTRHFEERRVGRRATSAKLVQRATVRVLQTFNFVPHEDRSSSRATGVVVVADDDDDVRMVLEERLGAAGYEVATAADGTDLMHLLDTIETPMAILIDLRMPGILGTSVLEYMRGDPRLAGIATAIVTGSPELAPPGFPLFAKPARFADLLAFVQQAAASPLASCSENAPERPTHAKPRP